MEKAKFEKHRRNLKKKKDALIKKREAEIMDEIMKQAEEVEDQTSSLT